MVFFFLKKALIARDPTPHPPALNGSLSYCFPFMNRIYFKSLSGHLFSSLYNCVDWTKEKHR